MTLDQLLPLCLAALPILNTLAIFVLGKFHFDNKQAIALANAGTAIASDGITMAATHASLVTALPKLLADAQAAGVAIGAAQTTTETKPNA